MNLQEIKTGEIFTIDETTSYPKLRIETGYIDMRDRIVKNVETLEWPVRVMSSKEVAEKMGMNIEDIQDWKEGCLELNSTSL